MSKVIRTKTTRGLTSVSAPLTPSDDDEEFKVEERNEEDEEEGGEGKTRKRPRKGKRSMTKSEKAAEERCNPLRTLLHLDAEICSSESDQDRTTDDELEHALSRTSPRPKGLKGEIALDVWSVDEEEEVEFVEKARGKASPKVAARSGKPSPKAAAARPAVKGSPKVKVESKPVVDDGSETADTDFEMPGPSTRPLTVKKEDVRRPPPEDSETESEKEFQISDKPPPKKARPTAPAAPTQRPSHSGGRASQEKPRPSTSTSPKVKFRAAVKEELEQDEGSEEEKEMKIGSAEVRRRKGKGRASDTCKTGQSPSSSLLASQPQSQSQPSSLSPSSSTPTYRPRPDFPIPPHAPRATPYVFDPSAGIAVPASINRWLRPYQRDGIKFFYERYATGRGGILGDDMGLGKTIQVIGFLAAIMKKTGDARDSGRRKASIRRDAEKVRLPTCLIVAPASVVYNWERELETWGYFDVGVYMGQDKGVVGRRFKRGYFDVLLTAFDTARGNIGELCEMPFDVVFVDEVHKVKNPKAQITQALHRLPIKARFGLTGTAIQNKYEEFWCILDWSNPTRLGTYKQWKYTISEPLKRAQSHEASAADVVQGRDLAIRLRDFVLPPFFLRRTKALIAHQLPNKVDNVVFCPLTPTQIAAYKRFLALEDVQLMVTKDDPCDCPLGDKGARRGYCCYTENSDGVHWRFLMLQYIIIFQKISNHLALLYPSNEDKPDQLMANREWVKIAFPGDHLQRRLYAEVSQDETLCGKWLALKQILAAWHREGGNKVLIFSMSVKLLNILEWFIQLEHYEAVRIDGKVPADQRMDRVDRFQNDPSVFIFLISTLAGGTGLNLTAANKVVIFDPNWNPSHDLQAMDRAFRIGQRRDVNVYRLVGAGSLEEIVYSRQIYKQQQMNIGYEASNEPRLFSGIQGSSGKAGELWGIKNIFRLQTKNIVTKHVIEKANLAQLNFTLQNIDPDDEDAEQDDERDADLETLEATNESQAVKATKRMVDLIVDGDKLEKRLSKPKKKDEIAELLQAAGISYTHNNAGIIGNNEAERLIHQAASATLRQSRFKAKEMRAYDAKVPKKKKVKVEDKAASLTWAPHRGKNKAAMASKKTAKREPKDEELTEEQLEIKRKLRAQGRMEAVVDLFHLSGYSSLGEYAVWFNKLDSQERNRLLRELDEHAEGGPPPLQTPAAPESEWEDE